MDGVDAALWDETTRVLVAIGVSPGDSTRRLRRAVHEALQVRTVQAGCSVADAGMLAVTRWREYARSSKQLRYSVGLRKFFSDGIWCDRDAWPWDWKVVDREAEARVGTYVPS